MTSSLAKKARSVSAAASSRAMSNRRSRENKYSDNVASTEDRVCSKKPICYDVDRRENGNCYNCRGFRHLARNYKNRRAENRIGEERKLEYGGSENNGQRKMEERNEQSNLNREGHLIVFD